MKITLRFKILLNCVKDIVVCIKDRINKFELMFIKDENVLFTGLTLTLLLFYK